MTAPTPRVGDIEGESKLDHEKQEPLGIPRNTTTGKQTFFDKIWTLTTQLERTAGLEGRGIQRVEAHERQKLSKAAYIQVAILWISINLCANNIALGLLGPAIFHLSFLDSALCAVFGALVGSIPVAYIATWGPISGNRTLIFARYTMGWWPSKLCVLLELVILLGYAMIDCVIAGQILSAVAGGNLTIVVGIIVVALISWVVTTLGIKLFHLYQRYAWIPQIMVLFILVGSAGPKFDTVTPSVGDTVTIAGGRLSFFSLCLSAAITYSPGAADYFVYYPETTSRLKIFWMSLIGLTVSFAFMLLLGIGLASGIFTNSDWSTAYETSFGALIVAGYGGLGAFGKFCGVVLALGLVSNIVAPAYSAGIDFQILGRYAALIPRFVWNTFGVVVYTVCALAGRNSLSEIFTNFLALMGYWVAIWIAITIEEQLIFRRFRGYDWTVWDQPSRLPVGIAALVAFLVGWVGAVLCMAQVYYIGPLARNVGSHGGDMGNYVGFAWAAIVYPPLRYLERKRLGR
ncbi:MAG: hypothetical protein M1817_002215 [Caeruleum heppii]|nr:MAG: hypothetical protein M1817_002215 [Caeruleum heppii]